MEAKVFNGTVKAGDHVVYGALGGLRAGIVLDVHEHQSYPRLKIEVTRPECLQSKIVYYPYLSCVAKIEAVA